MGRSNKSLKMLALSLLLTSASFSSAHAQAAEQAIERLKTLMSQQDAAIEWERVDIDGDDAVLVGSRFESADRRAPLGDITLNGISRTGEGYHIDSIAFDTMTLGDVRTSVVIEGARLDDVLLPDDASLERYGGTLFYETLAVGSIVVAAEDSEIASVSDVRTSMSAPADGSSMAFSGGAAEFYMDLSRVANPTQAAIATALGYEEITGSVEFGGEWRSADGGFTLSRFDTIVDDAGTLGVTLDLGGYTPDFLTASLGLLQRQADALASGDNPIPDPELLGLSRQITFHGAEISFTDDSLTGKILEFLANAQGMRPADIANQTKALLPFALAQFGNPQLATQAAQAISRYLDNPQTLHIRAEPATPVPFSVITEGAPLNPAELTKTLGVTVSAND